MAIKLKLDDKGNVVVKDGMPVYVHDDGKELPFDAAGTLAKIEELNTESAKHRHEKKEALAQLKAFDGLDPALARKALELTANLDAKKLIDAGEVEKVKESIGKAFEAQLRDTKASFEKQAKELTENISQKDAQIFNLMVTNRFSSSKFVAEKLSIPADLAEARFGKAFKIEEGKVVALDSAGKPIYSRKTPGTIADFDEALEVLVSEYPNKDHILKGTGASGGGKQPGSGGGENQFFLTREQAKNTALYEKTKAAAEKAGAQVTVAAE